MCVDTTEGPCGIPQLPARPGSPGQMLPLLQGTCHTHCPSINSWGSGLKLTSRSCWGQEGGKSPAHLSHSYSDMSWSPSELTKRKDPLLCAHKPRSWALCPPAGQYKEQTCPAKDTSSMSPRDSVGSNWAQADGGPDHLRSPQSHGTAPA